MLDEAQIKNTEARHCQLPQCEDTYYYSFDKWLNQRRFLLETGSKFSTDGAATAASEPEEAERVQLSSDTNEKKKLFAGENQCRRNFSNA